MSLYALRPRFQSLLRPSAQALHAAGVTANQVTIAACLVSVLLGAWLASRAGVAPGMWVDTVLGDVCGLSLLTVVNRVRQGIAQADGRIRS